jgi:hypothetical protein
MGMQFCVNIYQVLRFCCGFRFFHDATYEISTHVTVHGVGPIFCDQIIECFTWQKFSVTKTIVIAVGTMMQIHSMLYADHIRIDFGSQTFFGNTSILDLIQNLVAGHAYVADIAVVMATRFHTGVPPADESSVTATAMHSAPESPLLQNATSP